MNTDFPDPQSAGLSAEDNAPAAHNASESDSAQVPSLTAERDRLAGEKAELHDLLLRHQAEFNNFRRRTERDRSDFVQYAGMEFVREVLPVLDDFERALQADAASKDYAKGIELIYQRMYDALKKMGLEPIETTGKLFDPHLHQAVEKVQTTEAEDHAILAEFQRGYHFKGKMLRPSMVKVAVRP
ncbi:MAG: nucleotide exchange factor GrpE [Acidobacteriota bacterium]|nr:nucleotide exchange factor GrpE [Acidobacteriota bacterium]